MAQRRRGRSQILGADIRGRCQGQGGVSRVKERSAMVLPATKDWGGNDYQVEGMFCYWLSVTTGGNLVRPRWRSWIHFNLPAVSHYWWMWSRRFLSGPKYGKVLAEARSICSICWIEMEIFLVNLWSTDGNPEHGPWAALWCNKKDKFVWVGHCISDLLKSDTTWASRGTACSRDQGQNFH